MCTTGVKLSVKLGFSGVGNPCLALFSQSEVAIPSKMDIMELYHAMNSIHLLKPLQLMVCMYACKQCQKGQGYNNSNLKAHLNRPEWACSLQLHNTFICCAIRTGLIEVYTEMAAIPLVAAPIIGK